MSYRCQVCREVCPPKQPRLVHVETRPGKWGPEIAREVPVCKGCHDELRAGADLGDLARRKWVDPGTPGSSRPEPPPPPTPAGPLILGKVAASAAYGYDEDGLPEFPGPVVKGAAEVIRNSKFVNGGSAHRYEPRPVCDLCGTKVGPGDDAQVTGDAVICPACLDRQAGGPPKQKKGRKR